MMLSPRSVFYGEASRRAESMIGADSVPSPTPSLPSGNARRVPETETAFMEGFVASLAKTSPSPEPPERIRLYELRGLIGQPDLVDVEFQSLPGDVSLEVLAMSLSSPAKARVLALLKYGAPRRREYLEKLTGFPKHALRNHVQELEIAGLVEVHRTSSVSLKFPLPWTMANIVVYEGKLTNWRRALQQAIGYRSFCHRLWV